MAKLQVKDALGWDVENWGRALNYWDKRLPESLEGMTCLELGANKGGLSLWLADKKATVVCSDLADTETRSKELHSRFQVDGKIFYEDINALKIPYSETFDVVVFKSILGGIARNGQSEKRHECIAEIYSALKPGGLLLFSENLVSTSAKRFLRKKFVPWGADWNYLKMNETKDLLKDFSSVESESTGLLGALGKGEKMRSSFGKLDGILAPIIPNKWNYIWYGVAKK